MSSLALVSALVAILLTTIYFYLKYQLSYWKRRGVPFVKPSLPFGNFGAVLKRSRSFGQQLRELYNSSTDTIVGVYIIFRPALVIRDPKIVNEILIKNFSYFSHRGVHIDPKNDPLANNLLLQNGEAWKKMRSTISPAFSTKKLKGMVDTLISCGRLLEVALIESAKSQKETEVKELFERYTTTVIASVGFGLEINSFENPNSEFRKYSRRSFEPLFRNMFRILVSIMSPFLAKTFGIRFADRDIKDFMTETVLQNLNYREQNNIIRKDFFQLLMQLRNSGKVNDDDDDWSAKKMIDKKREFLSLDDMTAQAFIFITAGYETSSSTMSFCLFELAKNPHIQQKVHEEITQVLQKYNGKISYESLKEMKYLNSCIDETLRMHPPFDTMVRECTKDFRIPDTDVVIEKGTPIFLSITGFHYDPTYYDEPNVFKPERFIDDQTINKNSINRPYLAFGDGPRNCIGQRLGKLQTKIGLCIIFHKFFVELGSDLLNNEVILNPKSQVRAPINGMRLILKPRQ